MWRKRKAAHGSKEPKSIIDKLLIAWCAVFAAWLITFGARVYLWIAY